MPFAHARPETRDKGVGVGAHHRARASLVLCHKTPQRRRGGRANSGGDRGQQRGNDFADLRGQAPELERRTKTLLPAIRRFAVLATVGAGAGQDCGDMRT